MFKIVKQRTAWWPVSFTLSSEDGGTVEAVKIELQFRLVGMDERASLSAFGTEVDAAVGRSASERVAAVMMRIIADWRGIAGDDGVALPFSETNLAALVDVIPEFSERIVTPAFLACLRGEGELREKN